MHFVDVFGDVFVEVLADFHQFVLQRADFGACRIIAIDAGTVVVAQRSAKKICSRGVEPGSIERGQDVVHVFVERNVGQDLAGFLFADLGCFPKILCRVDLFGQTGTGLRVIAYEQSGIEGLQCGLCIGMRFSRFNIRDALFCIGQVGAASCEKRVRCSSEQA